MPLSGGLLDASPVVLTGLVVGGVILRLGHGWDWGDPEISL